MIHQLQKLREGTEHESYRITIPKDLVKQFKLENKKFMFSYKKDKIILEVVE